MRMIIIIASLLAFGCVGKIPAEKPGTGEKPPDGKTVLPFSLPDRNNESKTFASETYPGAVYAIEAFGNLCEPCNENAENVDKLAADYTGSKVHVIDLSTDAATEDTDEWVERYHPKYPVLHDQPRNLIRKLRIKKTPTLTVVGCNGEIVYQTVGKWDEARQAEIRAEIDAELLVCEP